MEVIGILIAIFLTIFVIAFTISTIKQGIQIYKNRKAKKAQDFSNNKKQEDEQCKQ